MPGAAGGIRDVPSSVRPDPLPPAEGTGGGGVRGWPEPTELPGGDRRGGGARGPGCPVANGPGASVPPKKKVLITLPGIN